MAFNVTGLTEYVEQHNEDLLVKAILGGDMFADISIQTGVKKTSALNILDVGVSLADGTACGFSPSGRDTFTQREITVSPLKVNKEWCTKDLDSKWMGYKVNTAANNDALPFEEDLLNQINLKVQSLIGFNLWQGNVSGSGYDSFDGIMKIAGTTPVTIGASDTISEAVNKVYMAIPEAVLEDAVIYVSPAAYRTLVQELTTANLFHVNAQEGEGSFLLAGTNTRVIKNNYLSGTKHIYAVNPKNIYFGTDLESDSEEYDLFYSKDNRTWRLVIEFKAGVQIGFLDEVVYGIHN